MGNEYCIVIVVRAVVEFAFVVYSLCAFVENVLVILFIVVFGGKRCLNIVGFFCVSDISFFLGFVNLIISFTIRRMGLYSFFSAFV